MRRSVRLGLYFVVPLLAVAYLQGILWAIAFLIPVAMGALTKVIYYSFRFNDCKEAADSLRKEIVEARTDLTRKGFNFVTQ